MSTNRSPAGRGFTGRASAAGHRLSTLGSCEAERQQYIAEIKQLLAAADLVSKDMFLTQPPAPKNEEAYAAWEKREHRRRPIARRMTLYGLTAHDLAPSGACVGAWLGKQEFPTDLLLHAKHLFVAARTSSERGVYSTLSVTRSTIRRGPAAPLLSRSWVWPLANMGLRPTVAVCPLVAQHQLDRPAHGPHRCFIDQEDAAAVGARKRTTKRRRMGVCAHGT